MTSLNPPFLPRRQMTPMQNRTNPDSGQLENQQETPAENWQQRSLSLALVFALHLLLVAFGLAFGYVRMGEAAFIGCFIFGLTMQLVFLLLTRFAASAVSPPDLLLTQIGFSLTLVLCTSLFLAGPSVLILLPALALTLIYAGHLSPARWLLLALYTFLLTAGIELLHLAGGSPGFPPWLMPAVFLLAAGIPALVRLELLSMRSALVQRNQQLEAALQRIQEIAVRDDLTGCHNRRYLFSQSWREGSETFALLYMDVDHFKRVNDLFGHTAGDRVLSQLASLLCDLAGEKSLVTRPGGDEFLLLLRERGEEAAREAAAKLAAGLRELQVDPAEPDYRITVSMSLVSLSAGESFAEAMERADKALYEAKNAGRDRLVSAY